MVTGCISFPRGSFLQRNLHHVLQTSVGLGVSSKILTGPCFFFIRLGGPRQTAHPDACVVYESAASPVCVFPALILAWLFSFALNSQGLPLMALTGTGKAMCGRGKRLIRRLLQQSHHEVRKGLTKCSWSRNRKGQAVLRALSRL